MLTEVETARLIRVFVSSPGDCEAERLVLDEVVGRINRTQGMITPVRLELFKWKENVVPQIGDGPQPVIDRQTPPYDIYLGIMGTRFGTPTGRFGSGTEKEFFDALKRYRQHKRPWILFYFNESAVSPGSIDPDQIKRVLDFRKKASKLGVYREYRGLRGSSSSFFEQVELDLRGVTQRMLAEEFESTLKIDFPGSEGGIESTYVMTPSSDRKFHASVQYPAKYVRVRVQNLSNLAAKNCMCELVCIEVLEAGEFCRLPFFESLRLAWNFEWDNAPPDHRRDIPARGTHYADILYTYDNHGSQGVFLRALSYNPKQREILELNRTYRLTIRASADGRRSQELRLRINFSENWEAFDVVAEQNTPNTADRADGNRKQRGSRRSSA
jgi:hypothetical protein